MTPGLINLSVLQKEVYFALPNPCAVGKYYPMLKRRSCWLCLEGKALSVQALVVKVHIAEEPCFSWIWANSLSRNDKRGRTERLSCPGAWKRNLCLCMLGRGGSSKQATKSRMQERKVTEDSPLLLCLQSPSELPPVCSLLFPVGVVGREVQELVSPLSHTSADLSFHRVMNQTLKAEQSQPNCCLQELLLMWLKCVMRLTYFSDWLLQWP